MSNQICSTITNNQNQYTICVKNGRRCKIMYKRAKTRAKRKNPEMTEDEINQLILPDLENAGYARVMG